MIIEKSALVYVILLVVTVTLGLFVQNAPYTTVEGYRVGQANIWDRQRARNLVAETAVFVLLTGVSACRIAVGNDYWPYRFNFRLIAQKRHVSSEFGFNMIVKGMQKLFGYDQYLPIFGLFSFVTVLFFVLALHAQAVHYAFSLFLLMAGGYYFNSLNSVRYYLALAIALYAMKYVLWGEYGKFFFWILAGSAFHKSIVLVLVVYAAAKWLAVRKLKKWHYLSFAALAMLAVVFGRSAIRKVIFFFYPFYRGSAFDNGEISWANLAKCVAVLGLCAVCAKKSLAWGDEMEGDDPNMPNRFYFFLHVFALVTYTCGSFIPETSRIGYYMLISQVFLIPQLIGQMDVLWLRRMCKAGVIVAFLLYFVLLLRQMYSVDIRLLPYLNWIFN